MATTVVDGPVLRFWLEEAIANVKSQVAEIEAEDDAKKAVIARRKYENQGWRMVFGMQRNYDEVLEAVTKKFLHGEGSQLHYFKWSFIPRAEGLLKSIPSGNYKITMELRELREIREHAKDED